MKTTIYLGLLVLLSIMACQSNNDTAKESFHFSAQQYDKNVLRCETQKFIIHINYKKESGYSYVSWNKSKTVKDKPSKIIKKGIEESLGKNAGLKYTFVDEPWTYVVIHDKLTANHLTGYALNVYYKDELKIDQPAVLIKE